MKTKTTSFFISGSCGTALVLDLATLLAAPLAIAADYY